MDMRSIVIVALLMLTTIGCEGAADTPVPRLPQLIDVGGPKLAHPQLVPIFYADYSDIDSVTQFSEWIVTSSWLDAVGAEYGVGAGSVLGVVRKPEPSPDTIDDTGIVDMLYQGLADGTVPKPTADTLYMIYFTSHTTVTAGSARSCNDFFGYHSSARRDGVELAYAVITACATVSIVGSHELIEAATDPFPSTHPGFQLRDPTSPWLSLGGEVADLCQRGGDPSETWTESKHVVQRSWSNAAAAAEQDPCVPHVYGPTYFNVVPDIRTVQRIPPGGHQQIDLEGWSSNGVVGWKLTAEPATFGEATLTLGANTIGDGRPTTLDIAIPSTARVGSLIQLYLVSTFDPLYQFLPLPVIAGDPCTSFSFDCVTCTTHTGCGFCESSGRCEAMGATGSAESSCSAKSFATWPGSCPGVCASHARSCLDCATQIGCGWCASGDATGCMEASHDYSHPETGACAYADWSFSPNYCPR